MTAYRITYCLSGCAHCWNCVHYLYCSLDCASRTDQFQQIEAGLLSGWHGPEQASTAGLLCDAKNCRRQEAP